MRRREFSTAETGQSQCTHYGRFAFNSNLSALFQSLHLTDGWNIASPSRAGCRKNLRRWRRFPRLSGSEEATDVFKKAGHIGPSRTLPKLFFCRRWFLDVDISSARAAIIVLFSVYEDFQFDDRGQMYACGADCISISHTVQIVHAFLASDSHHMHPLSSTPLICATAVGWK